MAKVEIVRSVPVEGLKLPKKEILAGDLVAIRYLHFLFKKRVAEATGIPATTNDDVDWEDQPRRECAEDRLVLRIESP